MIKFVTNLKEKEFSLFVDNHPSKAHFLQSPLWGEINKERKFFPHYVGLKKDNQLIATALILEKRLYFGYCYFYIPRGYVLDYSDKEVIKIFTEYLKVYAKKNKALFIKMDPDIKLHSLNKEGIPLKEEPNNYALVKYLESLGFQHQGYNLNFEGSQPRYTFRIDLTKKWKEIIEGFSNTTKQRIKKALEYEIEVLEGTEKELPEFFRLVFQTEERKQIYQHDYHFYQKLYRHFLQEDKVKLFLGRLYPDKIIKNLEKEKEITEKELEKINNSKETKKKKKFQEVKNKLIKIDSDLKFFLPYKDKYPKGLFISAQLIVYYGDKGWVLYAGNDYKFSRTYANYLVYQNHIEEAYQRKVKIYDQFGTVGDLRDDNPLKGLHEFKRKFGGEYIEFIGEFDLIINKFLYYIFIYLIPFYRKIKRRIIIRRIKK
ncbi:MAG: lipid II:glycine glycyltransferase FemX [Bacilli bacterium]|jgi:peptidoglycan pentaglycine glycine transferase (the first glycine)